MIFCRFLSSLRVLTDDNFTSIVKAVEKGRAIYAGIQKFVAFIMSVHIAEAGDVAFLRGGYRLWETAEWWSSTAKGDPNLLLRGGPLALDENSFAAPWQRYLWISLKSSWCTSEAGLCITSVCQFCQCLEPQLSFIIVDMNPPNIPLPYQQQEVFFGAPFFFFVFLKQICLLLIPKDFVSDPGHWFASLHCVGHGAWREDTDRDMLTTAMTNWLMKTAAPTWLFLGDGQNAPKFVGCKSVLVVWNRIFPLHRCGEEHLGSASKTERGTHRCSVKSVEWWIRFTRKWSKPEVKTGDFLNTSGSLKPIRSNWLAQAFFCVTQSCCHARYQLKHREYYGIFLFLYVRKIARSYAPLRFWVGCGWAFVSMALSCLRWLLGSMSLPCSTTWVWCSYRTSCPWRIQEVEFGRTCRDEVKWSTHSEYTLVADIHVTYDLCWKFVSAILKHTQLFHLPFFESRSVMLCRMLGPFSWIRNFLTAGTTQIRRHLTLTRRDRRHRPEPFQSQDSGLRLVGLLRLLA